ncbi:MAG: hypothetical protein RMI01_06710 [Thermodesulfovibrio sp.]|nr:hypothetical protein [Thermodesulfovibrio sp.]
MKIERFFIVPEDSLLVVVDVQEKLVNAMKEDIVEKILKKYCDTH